MAVPHSPPMAPPSFAVRIDRGKDGLYYATCLDLQGCHTFGTTREDALAHIKEVILDHLQARMTVRPAGHATSGSELVDIVA